MVQYLAKKKKSTKYIIMQHLSTSVDVSEKSVSLKESYVILQIPGSFAEGEEINGCVHKKVNILK